MKQQRPVNLDLRSLHYPPMAIASILHRISGLILFLLLPVILYFFSLSLDSVATFDKLRTLWQSPFNKLILWGFSSALFYHIFAGFRHMAMDIGFAEDLPTARRTAILVIVLAVISTILLGIWIW